MKRKLLLVAAIAGVLPLASNAADSSISKQNNSSMQANTTNYQQLAAANKQGGVTTNRPPKRFPDFQKPPRGQSSGNTQKTKSSRWDV